MYSNKLKKWSLARCQNTKYIYSLFRADSKRAELMVDDMVDFRLTPLVLIRKDYYEELIENKATLEQVKFWEESSRYWSKQVLELMGTINCSLKRNSTQ